MSQPDDVRPPDKTEESESVKLGKPSRPTKRQREAAEAETRPNLDERHRRISDERKPMGPPLDEAEAEAAVRDQGAPPNLPTDPSES